MDSASGVVIRVVVLAAAMSGLRQSELVGLRWRDVDWAAERIRVLAALDGMMDQAGGGPAPGEAHLQRVDDQLGAHVIGHAPPTIRREYASWTAARYNQPSQVRR